MVRNLKTRHTNDRVRSGLWNPWTSLNLNAGLWKVFELCEKAKKVGVSVRNWLYDFPR
jgi:hypothetical protein